MLRQARFRVFGSLFAVLLLGGCGSGSSAPMDGGTGTGGSLGGSGGSSGGSGGSGGVAGSGTAGTPMPTGMLVGALADAVLISQGPPCSWEPGATTDRWCAFIAASTVTQGNGALYALNVTKAAAGVSINCASATDVNCVKLTDMFGENSEHRAQFGGDTLVYYELTGTPFAWRPGMSAGRALATADPTTLDVRLCTVSSKGGAAFCVRDLPAAMQTDATIRQADLLAGKIDGAATPPLARVETVIRLNMMDVSFPHFQVGFPVPGSETIAWSSRATASGPEILKMQTIGNDASRATIATGVNNWTASPDGSRWYWLNAVNETSGAGELQAAPYPGGAGPIALTPNVVQYDFPTPTSILAVNSAKNLLAIADPVAAPTTSQMLDTGVIAFTGLSTQGHATYVKTVSSSAGGTMFADLYVKKSDGTGACAVTSATDSFPFNALFTPGAGGLAWIKRGLTSITAQFTRLSDCVAMNVGSSVVWTEPIGDRAILFLDSFSSNTGTGSMKFRTVAAGAVSADPAEQISGQVGTFMVLPTGGADVVVYTVNSGGTDDGVYVRVFGP